MQEELEVPYELKKYQRTPEMTAPPELKAVNPLGTAPAITDEGLNLAESGAIVGTLLCGLRRTRVSLRLDRQRRARNRCLIPRSRVSMHTNLI